MRTNLLSMMIIVITCMLLRIMITMKLVIMILLPPFGFRCRDVFFCENPLHLFPTEPAVLALTLFSGWPPRSVRCSSPARRRAAAALSPLPSPPYLLSRRRALLPHLRWPRRAPLLLPAATDWVQASTFKFKSATDSVDARPSPPPSSWRRWP